MKEPGWENKSRSWVWGWYRQIRSENYRLASQGLLSDDSQWLRGTYFSIPSSHKSWIIFLAHHFCFIPSPTTNATLIFPAISQKRHKSRNYHNIFSPECHDQLFALSKLIFTCACVRTCLGVHFCMLHVQMWLIFKISCGITISDNRPISV